MARFVGVFYGMTREITQNMNYVNLNFVMSGVFWV